MGLWKAQLAYDTTIFGLLAANPDQDPTGVQRATTALHMYGAVEAIEEFEDALVRVDNGHYGACQSCGRSIPIERLEVLPQTRFCAACPTAADKRLHSQRRRGRLENLGGDGPSGNWLATWAAVDPGLLAESAARHPSSLRYEQVVEDRAQQ
jgi:RNA polymerase-binding transcription factor DksA